MDSFTSHEAPRRNKISRTPPVKNEKYFPKVIRKFMCKHILYIYLSQNKF